MSGFSFESVFCGSDAPFRPSMTERPNSPVSKLAKSKAELEMFMRKTPLMVLEEGAKGSFQQTPSWACSEIPNTVGLEFEMTLNLRGKTVKARGNSKKIAKQKAALDYLHHMVNDGKSAEFSIPGETAEEAHANLNTIAERPVEEPKRAAAAVSVKDVDKSIPTAKSFPENVPEKNYVGALQEKCQKHKLEAPAYEDSKIEATSEFMVTCTMGNQQTRGIKPKIKLAKNLAAWLMLKTLEEGVEAVQAFDLTEQFDELEEEEDRATAQKAAFETKDKKSTLIDLLSDKARFADYRMEFVYPSVSTHGVHQVLLNVFISRPVSPDDDLQIGAEHTQTEEIMKATAEKEREQKKNMPDVTQKTFSGHGPSEEAAQQCACKSALIHYYTFDFTN
ncbi:Protein CBR-RDE-4 [Caenorhabditis briggsae]|uniref:DRBM domain-containing protein n=4 Tax=Caenorhabditis briggsae TaxID=6238 RepID=A0AAE9DDD5_CAEBR|nr:Protein CBR-RDE-4 [Caenorhabditis briggsae]ULU01537.1 hypothetical protein L3Y34_001696 [Caenorhabditis briggsae]UMM24181.1 hypothetical protein L5515_004540 [Caenorhabditis briggsae]CAP29362.1 Protein CBR-RDE-4 [Caenorhabditis briggsae]